MKHLSRLLIVAVLLTLSAQSRIFSQTLSLPGDGKDFWVGYMFPSFNKVANPGTEGFYAPYLLISTYTQNLVTISYFDKRTGVELIRGSYNIPARTGIQVPMEIESVKMGDTGDAPEFAACHVTAKRAINIEF